MRILHTIDSAGIYGAEVMLLNLMSEQVKIGLEPILLSIESANSESPSDLVIEAEKRGLTVMRMEMHRGYNQSDSYKIINYANSTGTDLIHSHGYKSDILLGFLPKRVRTIPVISTAHGWISVRFLSKIWLYVLLDKIAIRRLDAIVYVNPLSKNVVKHKQSFVVENGLPDHNFSLLNDIDGFFDRKNDEYIIGTISRLSEEKGLIYLLQSVRLLLAEGRNIKLVIIGDGPLKIQYQSYIDKYNLGNSIKMLGYKPNAYKYLSCLNLFILPSLTEGLPITILEAMQSGTPIIATNVGAIPSVLDNGKYGTIVNPANAKEIATAIKHHMDNRKLSLSVAELARHHVLENFSCSSMTNKYLDVYHKVIQK